jgi:hypothetical protein
MLLELEACTLLCRAILLIRFTSNIQTKWRCSHRDQKLSGLSTIFRLFKRYKLESLGLSSADAIESRALIACSSLVSVRILMLTID